MTGSPQIRSKTLSTASTGTPLLHPFFGKYLSAPRAVSPLASPYLGFIAPEAGSVVPLDATLEAVVWRLHCTVLPCSGLAALVLSNRQALPCSVNSSSSSHVRTCLFSLTTASDETGTLGGQGPRNLGSSILSTNVMNGT